MAEKRKAWAVFMHQEPMHLLAGRLNTLSNDGYTVVSVFVQGRDLFIVAWREE